MLDLLLLTLTVHGPSAAQGPEAANGIDPIAGVIAIVVAIPLPVKVVGSALGDETAVLLRLTNEIVNAALMIVELESGDAEE